MALKIRLLLTSACSARCAYCHNEGQSKKTALLHISTIRDILEYLISAGHQPTEIVLSGGEPTLHKQVADIARLCKETGTYVSMDSHAGHPQLLKTALPYLDELKVHIDAFDADKQRQSMGIEIQKVLASIQLAKAFPNLTLIANHPLVDVQGTVAFVNQARELAIDCKIIDAFNYGLVPIVHWAQLGYTRLDDKTWLHENGTHRIYTKRCTAEHNPTDTLFIGADGVRRAVDGDVLGRPDQFNLDWVVNPMAA